MSVGTKMISNMTPMPTQRLVTLKVKLVLQAEQEILWLRIEAKSLSLKLTLLEQFGQFLIPAKNIRCA